MKRAAKQLVTVPLHLHLIPRKLFYLYPAPPPSHSYRPGNSYMLSNPASARAVDPSTGTVDCVNYLNVRYQEISGIADIGDIKKC